MGAGDEIMVTAIARQLSEQKLPGSRYVVFDKDDKPRWSPFWEGNARIITPPEWHAASDEKKRDNWYIIRNGPSCRPYIDYTRTTKERWAYTDWRVPGPGELPAVAPKYRHGYIIVEPHIKPNASPNKQWGWDNWQALVNHLSKIADVVQLGPRGTRILEGAKHVVTPTFRNAAHEVSGAAAVIVPEGGLHHTAAIYDVPAVVLCGGMVKSENTRYDGQAWILGKEHPETPCGMRVPCPHCKEVWESISPEMVMDQLREILL